MSIDNQIEVLEQYRAGKKIQEHFKSCAIAYSVISYETHPKHLFNFHDCVYRIEPETGKDKLLLRVSELRAQMNIVPGLLPCQKVDRLMGCLINEIDAGEFDDWS